MMVREPVLCTSDQNLAEHMLQSQCQICSAEAPKYREARVPSGLYGAGIGGSGKGLWTEMADREISSPQDVWNFMNPQGAAGTDEIDQGNDGRLKFAGIVQQQLLVAGKISLSSRGDDESPPRLLLSRSVNRRPPDATSTITELWNTINW
jgi:hypothetical protein